MARLKRQVVWYIASEAVRRYGELESDLPRKLQRNIRRNHAVTVSPETVLAVAAHHKAIYDYAASILPRFIHSPPAGKYVDWSDVRTEDFIAAIRKRYPRETLQIVKMIGWYTIHYEYIR